MKKVIIVTVIGTLALCFSASAGLGAEAKKEKAGEELFKKHCAVCHPDGGNIINPKKSLRKKDMEANGIKSVKDIIGTMRTPGPGMNKFDEKTIPDKEAKEIAEYILKTFK